MNRYFVRSLTGLNPETARQAFSEFLDVRKFTEEQIYFVNCIVDYISQYGTLDLQEMADDEFAGGLSVVEVFSDNILEFKKIMAVVGSINANARPISFSGSPKRPIGTAPGSPPWKQYRNTDPRCRINRRRKRS